MMEGHIREKFVLDARDGENLRDLVIGVARLTLGRARIVIGPAGYGWYDDGW